MLRRKMSQTGYLRSHPWGAGRLSRGTLVRPGGCSSPGAVTGGGGEQQSAVTRRPVAEAKSVALGCPEGV